MMGTNGFVNVSLLRRFVDVLEPRTAWRPANREIEPAYIAEVLVILYDIGAGAIAEVGALVEALALNLDNESDRQRLIELVTEMIRPTVDELNSEVSR